MIDLKQHLVSLALRCHVSSVHPRLLPILVTGTVSWQAALLWNTSS